jgi:hypothetical protein
LLFFLSIKRDTHMEQCARLNPVRHSVMQPLREASIDFHICEFDQRVCLLPANIGGTRWSRNRGTALPPNLLSAPSATHLSSVRAGLAFLGEADPPLMHSFTVASRRSRSSGSVLIWIVSSTKRKLICLPVSLMRRDRRCIGIAFTCARSQQRP